MPAFTWKHSPSDLPIIHCSDSGTLSPDEPYSHIISTGRLGALCDRWGNVCLITTEGRYRKITPASPRSISAQIALLRVGSQLYSLHFNQAEKFSIIYGIGWASYSGTFTCDDYHVTYDFSVYAIPDNRASISFDHSITVHSGQPNNLGIQIRSDFFILPDYGTYLSTEKMEGFSLFKGGAALEAVEDKKVALWIDRNADFSAEDFSLCADLRSPFDQDGKANFKCTVAYTHDIEHPAIQEKLFTPETMADAKNAWHSKVYHIAEGNNWQSDEARWCFGQLLSFKHYDSSVEEYFPAIGGYCWERFSGREVCENLLTLMHFDRELGNSAVRWISKQQLSCGDIPKDHAYYREIKNQTEFESDLEIWYILGVCEYLLHTKQFSMLDEQIPFWDEGQSSLYDHLISALTWIEEEIGFGDHGLVKIMDGDWNDYLSGIGRNKRGESVMNSGMAARAFSLLASVAKIKGDHNTAVRAAKRTDFLRSNVAALFNGKWFPRAFTDSGEIIGDLDDHCCFLNAQTWAILGNCGTESTLKTAALSALTECHSEYGLTLMSKPYSFPPPPWISRSPIPQGEGENGGIWPQTVQWFIWGLCELGLIDEARILWEKSSFKHYMKLMPDSSYGVFNGPDNYSSRHAGERFGRTQVMCWNRKDSIPMQPAVAWQSFGLQKLRDTDKLYEAKY